MTISISRIVLATLIVGAAAGTTPANAGGYVGLSVSNHGVSVGFGTSNWGIWGSSWNSGGASVGFTATLSGYGEWVSIDGLGRVWRPWVAAGWQPYTHGRWVWTSMGWTWVAYEPWGWAPHHYGNWAYSTIGWVWSPGYVYHPGNVVWVSSGAHLGWYPCAPHGWSHSNRGRHHGWRSGYAAGHYSGYSQGYADGWRDARYATWVPRSSVVADNVADHAVRHEVATRGVARSAVSTLSAAPTRHEVERSIGRPVPEARVVERKATIDGRDVRMVRPEGQERTVQRHGGSTIQRALSPAAREQASGGDRRSTASTQGSVVDRKQQPRADARSVAADRTADRGRGSATRSTTTRSIPERVATAPRAERDRPTRATARSRVDSRSPLPREPTSRRSSSRSRSAPTPVERSARTAAPSTSQSPRVVNSKKATTTSDVRRQGAARNRTSPKPGIRNDRPQPHQKAEYEGSKRRRSAPAKK